MICFRIHNNDIKQLFNNIKTVVQNIHINNIEIGKLEDQFVIEIFLHLITLQKVNITSFSFRMNVITFCGVRVPISIKPRTQRYL